MDSESPDVIAEEMEATRQSLTEKVSALETEVVGTLQTATSTVHETVETVQQTVATMKSAVEDTVNSVKGTVEESVSTVASTVRSAFDVSGHVRANPWGLVAGAAAAGLVTGLLVFRRSPTREAVPEHPAPAFTPRPVAATPPAPAAPVEPVAPPALKDPTWVDELFAMAGREARKIGESAISTAAATLQKAVDDELPKLVAGLTERVPAAVAGFAARAAEPKTPARPGTPPNPSGSFQHYT